MTFWQENYGFVKDVYDFRLQKYQEWMDNLEAIVSKVMAPNVQYTYKEFKNIQDSLTSLCRDLEKEGMKEWLDMMLEKVAMRVAADAETGVSSKDKEFKANEKKKLQALIDRHDTLLKPTQETQAKVEIYARCYAYGDDISPCLKTLEEMRHLSVKEIHPHNMNMVDEQIDKAEKVIATIEGQRDIYEDLLRRGKKLLQNPNKAPFLTDLIEKMEKTWTEANEQSQARKTMLVNSAKDWEKYDEMRSAINDPVEKLEAELKRYRKFYDPVMGAKKLAQRKEVWEQQKTICDEMFDTIKRCYGTIIVLAGDDKKEFLDKEVGEVEEKRSIIAKCKAKLDKLFEYNDSLTKTVNHAKELQDWATPANSHLKKITTDPDMSPEERVKEILILQEQAQEKLPQVEPLDKDYKNLIKEDDLEKSETAKKTMADWAETKTYVTELCADIEKEAGSISTDQRLYADYLYLVKDFKPWVTEAEEAVKKPLAKPESLADALALLEAAKGFEATCVEQKGKLEEAGKARESMEKASSSENEVEPLSGRWTEVKKVADERVAKVQALVTTWEELDKTTHDLAAKMGEVPKQDNPNLEEIETVYTQMKDLYAKKKDLLAEV
ncbi:muscle-specific protein 300 kDa-like [Macrobrachium nipponense]|uniref:muscle-specific protein 300 kDa-like n=1 Tax=Macrobrachium nipponense TaxID=159736 RepID=UPI0030C7AE70